MVSFLMQKKNKFSVQEKSFPKHDILHNLGNFPQIEQLYPNPIMFVIKAGNLF